MPETGFFAPSLLLTLFAYFLATASPGPSVLAIMGIAMNRGRVPALAFAAGVISGSFFWGLLAALGLSAILLTYSQVLVALKIVGGLYLLWLALKSARAAFARDPGAAASGSFATERLLRLYGRGLALHLTNPKAIMSWLAIVSLALPQGAPPAYALSVVASCTGVGVCVFCGYALMFSTSVARRLYGSLRRWLEGALAVAFGVAGIKLLAARA
jgi:threonine efflux protein